MPHKTKEEAIDLKPTYVYKLLAKLASLTLICKKYPKLDQVLWKWHVEEKLYLDMAGNEYIAFVCLM